VPSDGFPGTGSHNMRFPSSRQAGRAVFLPGHPEATSAGNLSGEPGRTGRPGTDAGHSRMPFPDSALLKPPPGLEEARHGQVTGKASPRPYRPASDLAK
jgi:hypothetical protein